MFKSIVGGDTIQSERKFGHPFSFSPFARLLFSANSIPGSSDTTEAYTRRWLVVPFPNRFGGENVNRNLLAELTKPEELSGFFNLAINAYQEAKERGKFTEGESTKRGTEQFRGAIDQVFNFVSEFCETGTEVKVGKPKLYKAYKQWPLACP